MPHRLLLADDSVTIRRVIELTFADEHVQVASVSSGREAIASIEASPPDIVLADAGMSDVTGYDIAAFIKGRADLRHIPVILLAGAFEPLDEGRARACGSNGVLVKPFEPQMAIARVRELLSGVPARTEAPAASVVAPAPPPAPPPAPREEAAPPAPPVAPPAVSADPAFDASLDRLDEAFARSVPQGAPALDAAAATDFANDLRELRSSRTDPAAFERRDFGDWDLPARPAPPPPVPERDYLDAPLPDDLPALAPAPVAATLAPIEAAARPAPPGPMEIPRPAPAAAAPHRPEPAPLADAFSSLLAAEEARPSAQPPARPGHAPAPLSEPDMDQIVDRLVARLGPDVRVAVIDLAERLVKAEIDRLKALR